MGRIDRAAPHTVVHAASHTRIRSRTLARAYFPMMLRIHCRRNQGCPLPTAIKNRALYGEVKVPVSSSSFSSSFYSPFRLYGESGRRIRSRRIAPLLALACRPESRADREGLVDLITRPARAKHPSTAKYPITTYPPAQRHVRTPARLLSVRACNSRGCAPACVFSSAASNSRCTDDQRFPNRIRRPNRLRDVLFPMKTPRVYIILRNDKMRSFSFFFFFFVFRETR